MGSRAASCLWRLGASFGRRPALNARLARGASSGGSSTGSNYARVALWSAAGGALMGGGYTAYAYCDFGKRPHTAVDEREFPEVVDLPPVTPTRRVAGTFAPELHVVLFQYQTCPYCSKVRAFLDAYGFSYDVVEVDAVLRQSIRWSRYKKVPIVLVKTESGRYAQLNDSSAIISALSTYARERDRDIVEVARLYPDVAYVDEDGKGRSEILNKYFLMHRDAPTDTVIERESDERKWRKWVDDRFVHTISPNVYRTLDEAYETFEWFADAGEWHQNFPPWEVRTMVNVGAVAMWAIARRLKKRHNLTDDVRVSIYNECDAWTRAIRKKGGKYMGGSSPDLSDLAMYGAMSSMEGCRAFADILENTKIKDWFFNMKEHINQNRGVVQNLSVAMAS